MAADGRAPVVVVDQLTKRYGSVTAVDQVSFEVRQGEVFALLGPNGAGKTSTVEMLEGFRARDGGEITVLGFDPSRRSSQRDLRERLGVVLQDLAVEPFLTVQEVLARSAAYYPHPGDVADVIGAIGLEDQAGQRVKNLSGGQQRRLDLGLGIIGNPDLLFLDEPTTGFDPSARRAAWDVVRNLASRGTTVILTTHYMDEADALADRLAVIAGGRIVATGTPESIGGRELSEAVIRCRLPEGMTVDDLPADLAGLGNATTTSASIELRTTEEVMVVHRLTGWAIDRRVALQGLTVSRLTLEDIYLRLIAESEGNARPTSGVPVSEAAR